MVEEMKKYKIEILGLSEVKKKGQGTKQLDDGYVLRYSGIPIGRMAVEGVGIITTPEIETRVIHWEAINSRLITVDLQLEETVTVIQIYAPTENSAADDKEAFYEELQKTADKARERTKHIMIMGDWNARVGNEPERGFGVLGAYRGEPTLNNNGERMIHFCIENQLMIGNTFFNHKMIHKYTFEAEERGVRSIIDYIVFDRAMKYATHDIKVIRGAEAATNHYLLIADTMFLTPRKTPKKIYERLKVEELDKEECSRKFKELVRSKLLKFEEMEERENNIWNVNDRWNKLKIGLLEAANESCGRKTIKQKQKSTKWWTDTIKEKVKRKKEAWKTYLRSKSERDKEIYKRRRNEAKEAIKEAKVQSWEDFGNQLEERYKESPKYFWQTVKQLRSNKGKQMRSIKDGNNNLKTQEKDILETWRVHYENKFADETPEEEEGENNQPEENAETPTESITEEEVCLAVKKMRNGKAAGEDEITPELIKKGGEVVIQWLKKLYNQCWETETIPQDWEKNVIVPIHKKGETTQCENYRAICLSSCALKIYSRILEIKLRNEIEEELEEEQAAYRKGRQTQDHIYTLRTIIEKRIGKGKKLHLAFIDLKAAFDTIPRKQIWDTLENMRLTNKIKNVVKSLYKNVRGEVRLNGQKSTEFSMKKGIKQGDSLSPLLFIIAMNDIIKKCKRRSPKTKIGNWNMQPVYIQNLIYADDIIIIAENTDQLQRALNIWNEEIQTAKLTVNIQKTKVMHVTKQGDEEHNRITLDNQPIEEVRSLEYLGVTITNDGRIDGEIGNRVNKANQVYYSIYNTILGKREVSNKTKLHIYAAIYTPTLTYGAESWTMNNKHKSKITAAEMKFLRKITGKTRRDRIRNTTHREQLQQEPLITKIEKKQMTWFGHLIRMREDRLPKRALEARVEGRRPSGRPRKTWTDGIEEQARIRGKTIADVKRIAADKHRYNRWIQQEAPDA